ncbi:MAG: 23S rRNA (adenine(2503)-C(2))-methyltransferase RlmN [Mariprofundaceae bacterium]
MNHDQTLMPLIGMDRFALERMCQSVGVKTIHAKRVLAWAFHRGSIELDDVADLPHVLRSYLKENYVPFQLKTVHHERSKDGTCKLLLALPDALKIETVLIPTADRMTQCISTQVGCAMGCGFCLTAEQGLKRNLSAAEMVAQIHCAQEVSAHEISNLVLMGMGEPLHNYEQVATFIRIAADPVGMAFSPKRITVSTSGLVPAIYRMIEDNLPCNLAVSLNATTDDVRSDVMPVNKKYPIAALLEVMQAYVNHFGSKRILVEYVMLAGINDSLADAERLAHLLDPIHCTINLLPLNPYPGSRFERPEKDQIAAFYAVLVKYHYVVVERESRGQDISAACGQLAVSCNLDPVSGRT